MHKDKEVSCITPKIMKEGWLFTWYRRMVEFLFEIFVIIVIPVPRGIHSSKNHWVGYWVGNNNLMMIVDNITENCKVFIQIKLIYENVKGLKKNLLSPCI